MKLLFLYFRLGVTLLIILCLQDISLAQNILTPVVLSSSGQSTTLSEKNIMVTWSIGEPVYHSIQNAELIITQGFHQAKPVANHDSSMRGNTCEISAYPIPTERILHLNFDADNISRMDLSDVAGRKLILDIRSQELDLLNLSNGVYFINAHCLDGSYTTLKVIKY